MDEARKILIKVRGTEQVDAEFEDLKEASEAAQAVKHPFRNLLKPKNRPQLIIGALGIPAFQQLTGNNSILFYAPVIFQSLGFGSGASLYSSIITGSMLVVGALVSMTVVDRLGRRFLFMQAGCQMIITNVVVAYILATHFGHGEELPRGLAITMVIMICLFVVAYGWSWGPLGWLVPSEIFPLETRSAGQSMVVCVNLIFTAAVAQGFLAALCHLRYWVFILFACLIVIMSLFVIFLLPETKQCRNVVWLPGSISEAAVTNHVCPSCTPGPVFMIQFKFRRLEIPPNYDVDHLCCIDGCDAILRELIEICGTGSRNIASTTGPIPCNSCGAPCALRTANTESNRGRKFYICQSQECGFFGQNLYATIGILARIQHPTPNGGLHSSG